MPRRTDGNHVHITEALRDMGATVLDLHSMGRGCPDIAVGLAGVNYLFEIKSSHRAQLTPDEERFRLGWSGQVDTISSWRDALEIMGLLQPEEK